jgi:hypothetical protein
MRINIKRRRNPQPWGDGEIDSIYVEPNDRYVVSLIVSYSNEVRSPEEAAYYALDLTKDEWSCGTRWFVYDRETETMHEFEQDQFEQGDFTRDDLEPMYSNEEE